VTIDYRLETAGDHRKVTYVIRDQGTGFVLTDVPDATVRNDAAPAQSGLFAKHGRGLTAARQFLDELIVAGTTVRAVMKLPL
jgi:hypothetical protein